MPLEVGQSYIAGYQYPVFYKSPVVNTAEPDRYNLQRLHQLISLTVSLDSTGLRNQASIGAVYENTEECAIRVNVFDGLAAFNPKQKRWVFTEHYIGVQNTAQCVLYAQSPFVFNLESIEAAVQFKQRGHYGGR